MIRKVTTWSGVGLAIAGFGLGLASLAVPWATYRVAPRDGAGADASGNSAAYESSLGLTGNLAVFQVDRGVWYVVALLAVLGLLLATAVTAGRTARGCAVAALVLSVAGMLAATSASNGMAAAAAADLATFLGPLRVDTTARAGATYGAVALPLLAIGAALLSVRTPAIAAAPAAGR